MWRPAHGATSSPGPNRPASWYGRGLGRPGPRGHGVADDDQAGGGPEASAFAELVSDLARAAGAADHDAEAPEPVTR